MENEETKNWYVYFIKEETTNLFKIGHANDVENRLKSLQTGNPRKLIVVHVEPFDSKFNANEFEHKLHDYFRMYSLSGEWFDGGSSLDYLIDGFKTVGAIKFLIYLKNKRECLFNSNLHTKYKNLLKKISKMAGSDIEHGNEEQIEYLQQELKVWGWHLTRMRSNRRRLIMGDR